MSEIITTFDVQDHLKSADDMAAYLTAAFEEGDAATIAAAIGDIAKAKGITAVAAHAGVTREALYKSLSADGNPRLTTLLGVLSALGLRLTPVAL